jgi:8-oxo-dGTP pyrophosphatase MutT (NUDIX family)
MAVARRHVDDDDAALWLTAEREIREETGVLGDLVLQRWHAEHEGQSADIDTHPIPARPEKDEGAH